MSETRRKTSRILIRALPEEQQEIRDRARAGGVSVPEYLRRSALGRKIDHDARTTAEALKHLANIGNNLNQMTRMSHLGQFNQKDVSETLAEVRQAAALLIGKSGPDR